jgi:hypothetical protein
LTPDVTADFVYQLLASLILASTLWALLYVRWFWWALMYVPGSFFIAVTDKAHGAQPLFFRPCAFVFLTYVIWFVLELRRRSRTRPPAP